MDIGPNTASLIERLAAQLGMTVEQVFPWYVKQQIVSSVSLLIVATIITLLGFILWKICHDKTDRERTTGYNIATLVGYFIMFIGALVLFFSCIGIASGLLIPYPAFKSIVVDISRLKP